MALAAALVALPRPAAALLALGGAALALGLVWPAAACYLLIPAVAFGAQFSLPVGPLRAGPTDLLVAALAIGALARSLPQVVALRDPMPGETLRRVVAALRALARREPLVFGVAAALGAYLLVTLLSALVAADRSAVAKEGLKWGEVLVVYALAGGVLRTPRQRWTAAWLMVACGVAEALIGYAQWVAAAGLLGQSGAGVRVFGTFGQPNPYAAYLNLALPIALALALFGRDARARWVAAGATALMVGAQLLADSRGGLLALVGAALVVVVVGWGLERAGLAVGLSAAVVGGLAWAVGLIPVTLQRHALERLGLAGVSLNGPIDDANFSEVERLAHWAAGLRMFRAHPVLGVGAGNYDAAYARYAVVSWSAPLGHAHNYYINAAAETGIIGLAAFLAALGTLLYATWRAARLPDALAEGRPVRSHLPAQRAPRWLSGLAWRRVLGEAAGARSDVSTATSTWEARALALGVLGVVVAVAVHSLVDDLFVHAMELQLALCVALVVAGARRTASRQAGPPG